MVKQKVKGRVHEQEKHQTVGGILSAIPHNVRLAIIWIVILAAVFFAFNYFFQNIWTPGIVKYEGLTFTKENVGAITVYHYAYIYQDSTGQLAQNNIYLRNNPAGNKISTSGNITYVSDRTTYIGIDTDGLVGCNDSSVAIAELAGFLKDGGVWIKGGSLNKTTAIELNSTYVNCEIQNLNLSAVIQVKMADETRVSASGLCYTVQAASCANVIPAVERFIVESIVQAKANTLANYKSIQNKTV